MGNGFTSLYLRMSGIDVTTVDINSHLMPDICCDLEHLPSKLNKQFDVVSCCEVLEHMPWESFANNIGILSNYAPTLFLTLPYGKRIMGYGGFAFFSKNMIKSFWLDVPLFKKNLAPGHFWELNHSSLTSTKSIIRVLREHYCSVKSGNFELNPYHRYFICKR